MKLVLVLFCLDSFVIAISLRHAEHSRRSKKGTKKHQPIHASRALFKEGKQAHPSLSPKARAKVLQGALKPMEAAAVFPSDEREQNKFLENISPEYKYQDVEAKQAPAEQNSLKISNFLDKATLQELAAKHLLESIDSENGRQHSTRGTPVSGLVHAGSNPEDDSQSLEKLNIALENTLPEYQFDKAERGPGSSRDSCVDLDPDCWKYEMVGLCSDSPDLAEKRFNCKKTCHLCVSSTERKRHLKTQKKIK